MDWAYRYETIADTTEVKISTQNESIVRFIRQARSVFVTLPFRTFFVPWLRDLFVRLVKLSSNNNVRNILSGSHLARGTDNDICYEQHHDTDLQPGILPACAVGPLGRLRVRDFS